MLQKQFLIIFLDSKPSGQKVNDIVVRTRDLLAEVGGVLNIFNKTAREWYSALMTVKHIDISESDLDSRIQERQKAREAKDWAAADVIRNELAEKGIILEDKSDGTRWKIKAG